MTAEQPLTKKDVERVGLKLYEIIQREIDNNQDSLNPEKLFAQAVREAGLR